MADVSLLKTPRRQTAASLVGGEESASLTTDEVRIIRDVVTPGKIRHFVSRYSGAADLDDEGRINNRHTLIEQMPRVLAALAGDLEKIGQGSFRVFPHAFNFRGVPSMNIVAELPGESEGQVLITAHLDSTAMSSHPPGSYDPRRAPAPGADDDGSGLAAVLAVAEAFKAIYSEAKPKRTLRFVLFNAEEQGLVGSQAYARDAALAAEPIEAVFQMDTIGFNSDENLTFEVHFGARGRPDVEAQSRTLAERIDAVREPLESKLPAAESVGTLDPADGRSDHGSFHARGIAACVTSEDFFAQGGGEPDVNPNYHMASDTVDAVDFAYAAEIARVVAGAAALTVKA